MTSGVVDRRKTLSCQSNRNPSSGDENPPSRANTTSDKRQRLIACGYSNILTEHTMKRGGVSLY